MVTAAHVSAASPERFISLLDSPTPAAVPRQAWLVFWVVFAASAVTPFNQYKVPPLIPVLLTDLHLTEVEAGLLMSVFSVSALALALPAGFLFRRFGPRVVGTAAVGSTGVGSALGALTDSSWLLLGSRLVEGIGMGTMVVLAIATIAAWFPPSRRALPMGIYTTWIPVGQMGIFAVAPPVYEALGWRAVWWVGSATALPLAVLFFFTVRLPSDSKLQPGGSGHPAFWSLLMEPGPWFLAAFFSSFHVVRTGFSTWTPTYLVTEAGWSLADAAWVVSLSLIVSVPAAFPGVWFIDRAGSRRRAWTVATVVSLPAFGLAYVVDPRLMPIWAVAVALLAAVVPTAVNAATPEAVRDRSLVGPAAGVVSVGRNGGQLLAPILIAPIVQAGLPWGWVGATLVVVAALGLLAGWRVKAD